MVVRASFSHSAFFRSLAVASILALALLGAGPAAAKDGPPGFLTKQPAMITPVAPGSSVLPIITVPESGKQGEKSGWRFDALPDGIGFGISRKKDVTIYVNHETSTVPFPYNQNNPNPENSQNDFDNAQLSEVTLSLKNAGVLSGSFVIPSSANYQRFCSNFLIGPAEGFSDPLLITNEEATDRVNRTGMAWPPGPDAEQAGLAVAYDPATGAYRSIYGLGRMNHENSVPIPGYDDAVLVTGDDTFAAPSSQLYMYRAADRDAVWNDQGHLYAFVSDDPAINDYGDLSGQVSTSGRFIQVPDAIADGDQGPLETWSNDNNVFQFIRIEDLAYDRNTQNVFYFADTGEPRAIPDPATGRLKRGPAGTMGPWPNGRIFKVVLDPSDPTVVDSLSIVVDGDEGGYNNAAVLHQPDNVETTANSILVTEDPGGHNQYPAGDPAGTTARVWRYDLATGAFTVVARVDQSQDPGQDAAQGSWETTGIVDASAAFGPGAFLINVQAHTIFVETALGPDLVPPPGPDWLYKREGGQLLLLRIPGA
jgi:hypothetical protein